MSDLAGTPVCDPRGRRVGVVADMGARLDDVLPAVETVLVRNRGRSAPAAVPIEHFTEIGPGRMILAGPFPPGGEAADIDLLLLGRDVLDVQVIDTNSRRLARVGEVDLAWDEGVLRVIAVDVGGRAILRRLGLGRLAGRASRDAIDWAGVHLASGRGHPLQLASPSAAVHRLDPAELAEVLARLPPLRGAEVLYTTENARATAALCAVHPELGADLIEVLPSQRAVELLAQMPDDEAADALRQADDERRDNLLATMDEDHAQRLRVAIDRPRQPAADEPRPPRRYWNILRGHGRFEG